ncbi:MAG: tRNA pseudouridine(55) synthase TruB [Firmicutes bacterium]|nr:tRNA pseudouridine(55) synthase TruB [Bacillota bacterium]
MLNGFINLYKEAGMTSAKAVAITQGILKRKGFPVSKIGHLGTLDPDAEGVLPIALGKATKLFESFLKKKKVYFAKFLFGKTSDTLDASGIITEENNIITSLNEIQAVLPCFLGEIDQMPPNYSAKSVNGVRAYELARKGKEVNLSPKTVTIYSCEVLEKLSENLFSFRITCGGGTYIRALARDIAIKAGTVGLMQYLKREESGNFNIKDSKTLNDLRELPCDDFIIDMDGFEV